MSRIRYNRDMTWNDDDFELDDDLAEPVFRRRYVRRAIPEKLYYGEEDDDAPTRYWTVRRVLYLLLIALTLLAFVAYELSFLINQPPPPPPTFLPLNLI